MTRSFHIGDVLSVTTGYMVSPEGVGGIYEILNFMTGDNLFTHVLPRASYICGPALLGQFPQLRDAAASKPADGSEAEAWAAWRDGLGEKHGYRFDVGPLPAGVWESKDPIAELIAMKGAESVIVVDR